tara:strand:+ start:30727 stop:31560 length:834 start_codon:yes stop_codon:yes gene_type:complete
MAHDYTVWMDKLNEIYRPLVDLNEKLADAVIDNTDHPLWAYEGVSREKISEFVQSLEYQDDTAEGGSTTYLPAVIGVPEAVCSIVVAINTLRSQMAVLLKEADKERTPEDIRLSLYLLDKLQLRRLNRKATARQFVVLDATPQAISFMWNQPVITKRLSKEEALTAVKKQINKYNDSEIRNKLLVEERMIEILPDEEVVARVYRPAMQPRVNLILHHERMPVRMALMPLFYPANAGDALPELSPLSKSKVISKRIKRSDALIQSEPYAPIMRVHRYK